MKLTKEEVRRIAQLARIGITSQEEELYCAQLSQILAYMEILNEVDTTGVSTTAQVTGLENITRKDVVRECPSFKKEEIIRQFSRRDKDLLKVKAVFSKKE